MPIQVPSRSSWNHPTGGSLRLGLPSWAAYGGQMAFWKSVQ